MSTNLSRRGILAASLSLVFLSVGFAIPPADTQKPLQIYFVDVEGGQATLFVTPAGQSLLIDTGWPGFDGRDADRIVAAAKNAGLKKIDFVLLTHYHRDHAGGVPQLAAKIPIGAFLDHGANREPADAATDQTWQEYLKVASQQKLKRTIAKPGDTFPLQGVETKVISSDGAVIEHSLPGAGTTNAACKAAEQPPADPTENPRSLGTLFTFGKLRILDLGDLTSEKEMLLMCPVNKLGAIDIYIVSHHGSLTSNSPLFLNGIAPRVAIMDNGAAKGGAPTSWDAVKKSPRLEDLWQLHFSNEGGAAHNAADTFIANLSGPDAGNYLKLSAWPDGNFEVFNSRTQATKRYAPAH
jgi:beta-lactamase superfamily II metal-dependent hydrolase